MPVVTRRRERVRRLQRWWRQRLEWRDPLTLGPVRGRPLWIQGQPFDRSVLRDYIRYSGDRRHPTTRLPLPDSLLRRLGIEDTERARKAREDERERRGLQDYLESEVMDRARRIAVQVESQAIGSSVMALVSTHFPAFRAALNDLRRVGGGRELQRVVARAVDLLRRAPRNGLYIIACGFFADALRDALGDAFGD